MLSLITHVVLTGVPPKVLRRVIALVAIIVAQMIRLAAGLNGSGTNKGFED
jgi:hypothetical protein